MAIYENRKKQKNPEHASKLQLLWLSTQIKKLAISPKADGTYSQIQIGKYHFEAEYVEQYDIYLVFDTSSYPLKHNDNITSRINWIRGIHPNTKNNKNCKYIIETINDLHNQLEIHNQLISTYIATTKDKIKWFPKYTCTLKMEKVNFFLLLDQIPNTIYKTDGWIINIDKHNPIKYKPPHEITIDLLYKDGKFYTCEDEIVQCMYTSYTENGIWRCYWLNDKKCWVPRDLRKDKVVPNPILLVMQLTKLHEESWIVTDLIKDLKYIYYSHEKQNLDNHIVEYLNKSKDITTNNFTTIIKKYLNDRTYPLNILDLGCGKGNLIQMIGKVTNKKLYYYGIDIDPSCIYIGMQRYPTHIWKWQDMTSKELLDDTTIKFDIIVANNSLHNCEYDHQLLLLLYKIRKVTNIGSLFYINFIDVDKIDNYKYNDLEITSIDIKERIYNFKYPWIAKEFTEKVISGEHIKKIMYSMNWILEQEFNNNIKDISLELWSSYHTCYLFIKK